MILKNKGLPPLILLVQGATNRNTIKHGTWAISNLCRGRPLPDFNLVKEAIPIICKVIME
jgi:importin subunit alpha-1